MINATAEQPRLKRDPAAWRKRRRELRRQLWDLLLADKPPASGKASYQTVESGASAIRSLKRNLERAFRALPNQYSQYSDVPFEFDGKVTWDTSIITYRGWPAEPPQRAVLRVPRNLNRPAPAVMCFHGHMAGCLVGKETVDMLAVPLAARGFVTLAPDVIRWGERRDRTYEEAEIKDWRGMSFYSERNLAMPLMLEGKTILGAMIWEHMRGVDALQSLKFVDPMRIGTIGWSMGGMQSFWLAAMDERIACGVEAQGICSYDTWAREQTLNALVCFIPGILRYTDTGEVGSLIAPRPFMCSDAAGDMFFPKRGILQVTSQMRNAYRMYGAADRFRAHLAAGGHEFSGHEVEDALRWLSRWLQPNSLN